MDITAVDVVENHVVHLRFEDGSEGTHGRPRAVPPRSVFEQAWD